MLLDRVPNLKEQTSPNDVFPEALQHLIRLTKVIISTEKSNSSKLQSVNQG